MTEFDRILSLQNLFMLKFNSNFFLHLSICNSYIVGLHMNCIYTRNNFIAIDFLKSVKSTTK